MERDFLGLNSKEPLAAVKREISDNETQWSFMNKASSFPHFSLSGAGAAQDDGMNKMMSVSEQNYSLSLSNPIVKPNFAGFGQNVADDITRQQFEGVPKAVTSPAGRVFGFTKPWNHLKSSTPPQMTIFYAGTVSVYQGISPEKAQTIMLLAGNGSFLASNTNPTSPQIQTPAIKVPSIVADGIRPSTSPSKGEQVVTKPTEISSACVSKLENQRVVPSRGPVPMPAMTPSVVPQFRKASLARFLEKRKERVMSTGPYTCEKKHDGILPAINNVGSAMP